MASRRSAGRRPVRGEFRRETDLKRDKEVRYEYRSILVLTNGESTEVNYFAAAKSEDWVTAGKVIVKFENGDPAAVVVRAATLRQQNDYDEAWAVCDVDEFDVTSAVAEAGSTEIGLALSVPSFEVWLILHLSDACPGFNNAKQASHYLRKILPTWDKTSLNFSDFQAGVQDAAARAKRLGEPPSANPSTAVWRVIESLARPLEEPAEPFEATDRTELPAEGRAPH
jgi:hypothetical protein